MNGRGETRECEGDAARDSERNKRDNDEDGVQSSTLYNVCVCVFVCVCVCVCVCTYIHTYIYIHLCVCVCVCVCKNQER